MEQEIKELIQFFKYNDYEIVLKHKDDHSFTSSYKILIIIRIDLSDQEILDFLRKVKQDIIDKINYKILSNRPIIKMIKELIEK